MKIVYPVEWPTAHGGMENSVLDLLDGLQGFRDIRPAVVCPSGEFSRLALARGARVSTVGTEPWFPSTATRSLKSLLLPLAPRRALVKETPDIFHANSIMTTLLVRSAWRSARGVPTILHYRGLGGISGKATALLAGATLAAQAVIVATDAGRRYLIRATRCDPHKVHVIGNPVTIRPKPNQAPIALATGYPRFAVVGRLVPYKGLEVAIRALGEYRLLDPSSDPRLVLIVSGTLEENRKYLRRLDAIITDLGLVHHVQVYPAPVDVAAVYGWADQVWVPSYLESFGRVAVEAMACGTTVVASRAGGLPSVIDRAGVLVPVGQPGELARAAYDLAHNAALRDDLIEYGLERAREFSPPAVAARVAQLYRGL